MTKSVFLTRKSEILRSKHIRDLVRHLDDPRRWPIDIDAHFGRLEGKALALAMSVHQSYVKGDPEFRRYAEALALVG